MPHLCKPQTLTQRHACLISAKHAGYHAHLPHQEVDIILKHIMKLLQGFTIALCQLLLLLLQQVHQQLVLEALY